MTIDLIRHGESAGNARRLIFGITDYDLTEKGLAQAEARACRCAEEGRRLIVSSPLLRALRTARIIASATGAEVTVDPRLREQDMGRWEGLSGEYVMAHDRARCEAMLKDWTRVSPPGGEGFESVARRAGEAVNGLLARGEDALVVCHAGTIAAALFSLGLLAREDVLRLKLPFGGGVRLRVAGDGRAAGFDPLPDA